jgi:SAM-dependent methyltransferase
MTTGAAVDQRFRDLAYEALEPYSRSFLARSGLREGMHVLEVGCGGGAMTPLLSRAVGPNGRVVAVDVDPKQLERARDKVRMGGIENVDLIAASVDDVRGLGRDFDLAYGRFILMQLPDPSATLDRLLPCLRRGGVIALDEPDQGADLAVPPCPPCVRANRVFLDFAEAAQLNFGIGPSLYAMLVDAGVRIRVAHVCQPILPLSDAIQMFKHGLLDSQQLLLERGILTRRAFEEILADLDGWRAGEADVYLLSRQYQVSGACL